MNFEHFVYHIKEKKYVKIYIRNSKNTQNKRTKRTKNT